MHGFTSKWTFLVRTTPDIGSLLKLLTNDTIRPKFLPALTKHSNNTERDLLALPACLGGIGIIDPPQLSASHYTTSKNVSASLVSLILQQSTSYRTYCKELQRKAKSDAYQTKRQHETTRANDLFNKIPHNEFWRLLKKRVHQAGSHPSQLQNMALRYIKELLEMPSVSGVGGDCHTCHETVRGKQYTIEHALSCACSGLPSIRHNELRDTTAQLLPETCWN